MKSDFSVKLTFHDQTIICHYIKKILLNKKKKYKQVWKEPKHIQKKDHQTKTKRT